MYRSATVGALSDRHLSSPDYSSSAPGGAPRHSGVVPWSDGRFATVWFGVARKPELGSSRRTDRDDTGGLKPGNDAVVMVRQHPAHGPAPDGSGCSGQGVKVLDRAGDAEERAGANLPGIELVLELAGSVPGPVIVDPGPGVTFVGMCCF